MIDIRKIEKDITLLLCIVNKFDKTGFATCYHKSELQHTKNMKELKNELEETVDGFFTYWKITTLPIEYAEKHIEFEITNNQVNFDKIIVI